MRLSVRRERAGLEPEAATFETCFNAELLRRRSMAPLQFMPGAASPQVGANQATRLIGSKGRGSRASRGDQSRSTEPSLVHSLHRRRKAHELVELGPSSIMRNPLYVFSFIGALGLGLQSGSITIGLIFLAAAMAVFIPVVYREEEILAAVFGEPFAAYCARVPPFWPKVTAWQDAQIVWFAPVLFYTTLRDGLVFVCVVPVFELIDTLQVWHVLPTTASPATKTRYGRLSPRLTL